jgi:ferredoxin-NADP reductase
MIRRDTEVESAHRIFLFYSIRRPEEAAFMTELEEIQELNPDFRFIPTITHSDGVPRRWRGETGHITESMVMKRLPDLAIPIFYIAGPPGMVAGVRQILCAAGVSDDDIRAEEFAGY